MKEIYCPRVVTSPVLCFLQKLRALQHGTSYQRRSAAPAQPRPREQSTLLGLPGGSRCHPWWSPCQVLSSLPALRAGQMKSAADPALSTCVF